MVIIFDTHSLYYRVFVCKSDGNLCKSVNNGCIWFSQVFYGDYSSWQFLQVFH